MKMTRKDRENWLQGRKVHGVKNYSIACRSTYSLASGWAFYEGKDLRYVTCPKCRKILKQMRGKPT